MHNYIDWTTRSILCGIYRKSVLPTPTLCIELLNSYRSSTDHSENNYTSLDNNHVVRHNIEHFLYTALPITP